MADASARLAADGLSFSRSHDLAAVRAFAHRRGLACGLPTARVQLLVLAVSELATNTLQHTSGGGEVRVWREQERVVCELRDGAPPLSFGPMPAPDSQRGRGLAIVARVADAVSSESTADGTTVRIEMNC